MTLPSNVTELGFMKLFVTALIGLVIFGQSHASTCLPIFEDQSLEAAQERTVTFKNVEVFRRNNNIGQQQFGDVIVEKWIELKPYQNDVQSFVGLTREGRLYHIVQWQNRRIARLLNGTSMFTEIFFFKDQTLIALDQARQVYIYSAEKWQLSPVKSQLKWAGSLWAGTTTAALTLLGLTYPEALTWTIQMGEIPIPLTATFTATASALNTGFVMLMRYERLNTYTDGFKNTGLIYKDDVQLSWELRQSFNSIETARDHWVAPNPHDLPGKIPEIATEEIR